VRLFIGGSFRRSELKQLVVLESTSIEVDLRIENYFLIMPSSKRRSLFGSSPTPNKSSTEETKRRSFAFMKYSPKRTSKDSMTRTREHARQIALQLSQEEETNQEHYEPPNAPLHDQLSHEEPFTSSNLGVIDSRPQGRRSPKRIHNKKLKNKFAEEAIPVNQVKRTPNKKLDTFFEEQYSLGSNRSKPPRNAPSSLVSADTGASSRGRTVNSMPSFPSNSTMQARNIGTLQNQSPNSSLELSSYPLNRSKGSNFSRKSSSSGGSGRKSRSGTPGGGVSIASTGASTANTTTSYYDNDLFIKADNGFSFDAFGLDENIVDQEVAEAMRDLAGEWGEEFPLQPFDSPNGSRSTTPPQDEDGFEDGFRVTGMTSLPLHVMQSPNGSERSSLTSSTDKTGQDGQPNIFKEKAKFHKSKSNTNHEKSSDVHDWAAFNSSAFDDAFSPGYSQSEPGLESNLRVVPPNDKFRRGMPENIDDAFKGFQDMPDFPESPASITHKNIQYDYNVDDACSDTAVDSETENFPDPGIGNMMDLPIEVPGKKPKKGKKSSRAFEDKWENPAQYESDAKMQNLRRNQTPERPSFREHHNKTDVFGDEEFIKIIPPSHPGSYAHSDIANLRSQNSIEFSNVLDRYRDGNKGEEENLSKSSRSGRDATNEVEKFELGEERVSDYDNHTLSQTTKEFAKNHVQQMQEPCVVSQANSPRNKSKTIVRPDKSLQEEGNRQVVAKHRSDVMKHPATETRTSGHFHGDYESHDDKFQENYQKIQSKRRGVSFQEQHRSDDQYEDSSQTTDRPTRRLTYREKRELELKKQQEELQRKEAEKKTKIPPKRDVAALIRKRVAANKRIAVKDAESTSESENFNDMKSRLKKVSMESKITQFKAREVTTEKGEPDFPVTSPKKLNSSSIKGTQPNNRELRQNSVEESREVGSIESWKSGDAPEDNPVRRDSPSPLAMKKDSTPPMAAVHELIKNRSNATASKHRDVNSTITNASPSLHDMQPQSSESTVDAKSKLNAMLSSRMAPGIDKEDSLPTDISKVHVSESNGDAKSKLNAMLVSRLAPPPVQDTKEKVSESSSDDAKSKLSAMLAGRLAAGPSITESKNSARTNTLHEDDTATKAHQNIGTTESSKVSSMHEVAPVSKDGRPALKDDPKYDRYFRMLKVGMPIEVVKHAMERDGVDPSVMDGDHNKPAGFGSGVPLKDDPKYNKYFKMLKMGLPMGAVKNALERDGLDPSVMDQDHNLPTSSSEVNKAKEEKKPKDTHRRTRLHWDTVRKVRSNSLWAKIDQDEEIEDIQIDEDEFQELFQAELTPSAANKIRSTGSNKKGAAVRVIDSKRANNGGIILARLKITHDDMAEAVDRIDNTAISAEQMQNVTEYLPTSEERKALEEYMLSGGVDAAEKFHGLCECEKFMVAMMTVKHAKRKVRALLFKTQFQSCLESLVTDTTVVEKACDELSSSTRLRKLLGIVLNVGNRLNTAGVSGKSKAGAFKLDSLLKLNQAKAFDKKTTFLHYIVLVVLRNNELLLRFKDDLPTVMKADRVYWDQVEQDLEEVENQLENVRQMSLHQARLVTRRWRKKKKRQQQQQSQIEDDNSLSDCSLSLEEEVELLRATEIGVFTLGAIKKVSALRDKVETTKLKFSKLLEYFGEDENADSQPHDVFNIIVTFCRDFEKAKEQVSENMKKKRREERKSKRANSAPTSPNKNNSPVKQRSTKSIRAYNQQPNVAKDARKVEASVNNDTHQGPPPKNHTEQYLKTSSFVHKQKSQERSRAPKNKNHAELNLLTPGLAQQQLSRSIAGAPKVNGVSHHEVPSTRSTTNDNNSTREEQRGIKYSPTNTGNVLRNVRTREQTTMRQKAMERRRRMKSSSSVTTVSTDTNPSMSVPIQSPDRNYATLPESQSKKDSVEDTLSPRSSIRQRRRNQMRQQSARSTPPTVDWDRRV